MVGYCTKDNGEEHFEFVHHNVSADDVDEDKLHYAKFKNVGLDNHVNFSHSNISQRAHQWACFRVKKHLGDTLPNTFISHGQD